MRPTRPLSLRRLTLILSLLLYCAFAAVNGMPAAMRAGGGAYARAAESLTGNVRGELARASTPGIVSAGRGSHGLGAQSHESFTPGLLDGTSGLPSLLKTGAPLPRGVTGGAAYGGMPVTLPGTVEAENFDEGGEGVSFHDLSAGNDYGSVIYRDTAVDIGPDGNLSNGHAVGYTYPGEWVEYTVDVTATGSYDLSLKYATAVYGGTFHLEVDGADLTGQMTFASTGSWGNYVTVTKTDVSLITGRHVLRLAMDTGGIWGLLGTVDYIRFERRQTAYPRDPHAVPGKIEAEDFDEGADGIAYHDADPGNDYGGVTYRDTNVDVGADATLSNGHIVGYTVPGEWLEYTVDVSAAGSYDIAVRYATPVYGGAFHVEADGVDVTGPVSFPATGSWGSYQTAMKTGVSLTAGRHVLRLAMDAGGSWGYLGSVDYLLVERSTAPTSLTVAAVSSNQINLAWADNSTDETGFQIERTTPAGGAYTTVATVGAGTTSWSDAGLTPGSTYLYRVRAANASGYTAYSNESGATTYAGSGAYSLSLNGVDGYVSVPNNSSLDISGPVSVEAWIKTNSAAQQGIVERYGWLNTDDGGYALRIEQGRLKFMTVRNANTYDFVTGATVVSVGMWHHVAGVFDGSELRVYLDGRIDGAKPSNIAPAPGTQSLKIGARGDTGGNTFDGLIDEVRVSSGVEHRANFTAMSLLEAGSSFENPDDGQRGMWLFDGATANDFTGNSGNNGTLVGGALFSTETFGTGMKYDNLIAGTTAERRVFIGFDEYVNQIVYDQYRDAVFRGSTVDGKFFYTFATNWDPHYDETGARLTRNSQDLINAGVTSVFGRYANFSVDFPTPASNIKFAGIGVDNYNTYLTPCHIVALINVYYTTNPDFEAPQQIRLCGRNNGIDQIGKPVVYDLNNNNVKNARRIIFYSITDTPGGVDFDSFDFTVPAPTPTPEVKAVSFEELSNGGPIDRHPSDPVFGCGNKCGQRIFPDKHNPDDAANRAKVRVKAVTTFPQGTRIYFKSFDLDDPSSDDPDVDPTGSQGFDNNGGPRLSGTLSASYALTDASGIATVEFETTKQPGDNFMVAAGTDELYLQGLTESGIGLRDADGKTLPTPQAKATEMLTVWRRLHIEVDSMGVVTDNKVIATAADALVPDADQIQTSFLRPDSLICVQQPLESNRFEGGRVMVGESQYSILSNDQSCLTVAGGPEFNPPPGGTQVTIYDDDDFNNNNGTAGDEGEDIPAPSTGKVLGGSAGDSPANNLFAPAYIRPVYDVGDNNNSVPFHANVAENTSAAKRALYDFDQVATEANVDFWTVYVLGAYQYTLEEDSDPNEETLTLGIVDSSGQQDAQGSLVRDGLGVLLFVEQEREGRIRRAEGFPVSEFALSPYWVPHEIGHLLGARHQDKGLMGQLSGSFSLISLNRIRKSAHP